MGAGGTPDPGEGGAMGLSVDIFTPVNLRLHDFNIDFVVSVVSLRVSGSLLVEGIVQVDV